MIVQTKKTNKLVCSEINGRLFEISSFLNLCRNKRSMAQQYIERIKREREGSPFAGKLPNYLALLEISRQVLSEVPVESPHFPTKTIEDMEKRASDDEKHLTLREFQTKYVLREKLGQGTFGTVNAALEVETGSTVVVKQVAFKDYSDDPEKNMRYNVTSFMREAVVASMLLHPNIGKLLDFFVMAEGDYPFVLVFELITHNLAELMKIWTVSCNPYECPFLLDLCYVKCIIKQILEALVYAHDRNVWHRDIKSDNIMVKDDGTVVLIDFGWSRIKVPEAKPESNISEEEMEEEWWIKMHGSLEERRRIECLEKARNQRQSEMAQNMTGPCCSITFRAPEVLFNEKTYDGKKVDMWAVGCVLYRLVNEGKLPISRFRGMEEKLAMRKTAIQELGLLIGQPPSNVQPFCERLEMIPPQKNCKIEKLSIDPDTDRFLRKLLTWNETQRMTAKEALEDPWIEGACTKERFEQILPKKAMRR